MNFNEISYIFSSAESKCTSHVLTVMSYATIIFWGIQLKVTKSVPFTEENIIMGSAYRINHVSFHL